MEHLLLKAATTATDKGTFTAVISTASVDRDKDIIEPSAMVASLEKWAALSKLVPLAWNHTDEVIGHIDPKTARVKDGEVIADGFIDQNIPRGEEAWRLVKSGTLSFSFGFLFDPKTGATKLQNGRYHVKELDIFEISVIPVGPANNDTRVLRFKAMNAQDLADQMRSLADLVESDSPPSPSEVAGRIRSMADQVGGMGKSITPQEHEVEHEVPVEEASKEPEKARLVDPLRKQAESIALEFASDGLSLRKPPRKVEQPKPEPEISLPALKQRMRDELLMHLSGETL